MIFTLHLESEQHKTDQKTTFSAEMLSLSKNAYFFFNMLEKEKRSTQWFWFLQWILHHIVDITMYVVYVYIYI